MTNVINFPIKTKPESRKPAEDVAIPVDYILQHPLENYTKNKDLQLAGDMIAYLRDAVESEMTGLEFTIIKDPVRTAKITKINRSIRSLNIIMNAFIAAHPEIPQLFAVQEIGEDDLIL
jgi:hypothetical protein